ncbi:hypothetical protein V8G54_020197 [Vigna mungo]|uniref:Uncharacterized protein n=1 Tax=Vigna mungo TaxID=3915 RepID=A0AAQ3NC47_VIGMU
MRHPFRHSLLSIAHFDRSKTRRSKIFIRAGRGPILFLHSSSPFPSSHTKPRPNNNNPNHYQNRNHNSDPYPNPFIFSFPFSNFEIPHFCRISGTQQCSDRTIQHVAKPGAVVIQRSPTATVLLAELLAFRQRRLRYVAKELLMRWLHAGLSEHPVTVSTPTNPFFPTQLSTNIVETPTRFEPGLVI